MTLIKIFVACILASSFWAAHAQPVTKFVTGTQPGASLDTLTRILAEQMAVIMNRTIIVENKVGASGNIAAEFVARAPADGKTALITYNVHPVLSSLFPNLRFDPITDFKSVGVIATTPYAVVANPKVAGSTLKEMLALAKTQGRTLNFGSIGQGSPQHLMMERLKEQTGVDIRMVHYKSATAAQIDVIAGHIDFMISTIAFCEPQVKAGKLKVLAVTSQDRLQQFPEAPTVTEAGYKGFITDGWYAMLLPGGTPPAVVKEYNEALNKVLESAATKEKLHAMVLTAKPGTPQVLDKWMRDDAVMWKKVITTLNIKPE